MSATDDGLSLNYEIRPKFEKRFRQLAVKEAIQSILNDELNGKLYNAEESPNLTKQITETIRNKLKTLGYDRYKFIVQVVLGEQRGAGFKYASGCLWDTDTDNYASAVFINDSLFCVAATFGVYFY